MLRRHERKKSRKDVSQLQKHTEPAADSARLPRCLHTEPLWLLLRAQCLPPWVACDDHDQRVVFGPAGSMLTCTDTFQFVAY